MTEVAQSERRAYAHKRHTEVIEASYITAANVSARPVASLTRRNKHVPQMREEKQIRRKRSNRERHIICICIALCIYFAPRATCQSLHISAERAALGASDLLGSERGRILSETLARQSLGVVRVQVAPVAREARVALDGVAERVLPDLVVGDRLLALVLLSAAEDILDLVEEAALVCAGQDKQVVSACGAHGAVGMGRRRTLVVVRAETRLAGVPLLGLHEIDEE